MKNWLTNLFSQHPKPSDSPRQASDELLDIQKEVQTLRLELESSEQMVMNLKQEIERLRSRQDQLLQETVTSRLEALFNDLAAPASQILTQADLLENQGKAVQARDILSVARRMIRALERQGVSFEEKVGDQIPFDPNRHTPLSSSAIPVPGKMVTVRFASVFYQQKMIYKAIVE